MKAFSLFIMLGAITTQSTMFLAASTPIYFYGDETTDNEGYYRALPYCDIGNEIRNARGDTGMWVRCGSSRE